MTSRRSERRLEVRITSEARQFDRGFQQAQRSAQSFGRQMDTVSRTGVGRFNGQMDIAAQRMRGFLGLAAGALAGGALVRWAGQARESANNLTESINAVNVVFEEAAGKVLAFGERAAESAGLANSEFNQLVVPIGSMLRNFGFDADAAAEASITLAQRAADMASVFNVEVSQALEAIQAALRGEADPIERFGASISAARVESFLLAEGLVDSKSAITDADKVMGRYKLILQDTARVAGDFANTADEDANKTRIFQARVEDLQARIGKGLLPAFGSLVDAGTDLLPVLDSLGTDVLPVIVEGFSDFVAGVQAIGEAIGGLPEGVKIASAALLGLLGTARLVYAHPVIAGLGLVTAGIVAIGDAARDEKEQVKELEEAIRILIETGDEKPIFEAVRQDIRDMVDETVTAMDTIKRLGLSFTDLTDFALGDPDAIAEVTAAMETYRTSREKAFERGAISLHTLTVDNQQLAILEAALGEVATRYSETAETARRQDRAEKDLLDTGEFADRLVRQRVNAEDALNRERGRSTELTEKQVAALEEEKARTDELTGGVRQLAQTYANELNTAALAYLDIFSEEQEVEPIQGVEQLLANADARVETISAFLSGLQRLRDEGLFELSFQFEEAGVSAQNVAEMEALIGDIDKGGATAFTLEETIKAAETETSRITEHMALELARSKQPLLTEAQRLGVDIMEAIAQGADRVPVNFRIRVAAGGVPGGGGGSGASGGGGVRGLASGGRFRPEELLVVGERGPELVRFGQGGMVHPNADQFAPSMIRSFGESGGSSVQLSVKVDARGARNPSAVGRSVVREVSRELEIYESGARRQA